MGVGGDEGQGATETGPLEIGILETGTCGWTTTVVVAAGTVTTTKREILKQRIHTVWALLIATGGRDGISRSGQKGCDNDTEEFHC